MPGRAARDSHQPSPSQSSASEDEDNDVSTQSVVSATNGDEVEALETTYPPDGEYADEEEEEEEEDEDEEDDALEVVVETLLGGSYRVRVSQWDTPAGLKDLLFRTQGIPPSHQHLVLGERELVEEMCLVEQGVVDGSRLKLVLAMTGGPVNTRRLPSHDDRLWQDFSDYIDVNKDELWEGVGGRTVTLLVLQEGENVNLYRVVENQDGSYSPLNESWGSLASGRGGGDETGASKQMSEEEARTRERVADLKQRMEDLKLRNKNKKEKNMMPVSAQRSLNSSMKAVTDLGEDLPSPRVDIPEGVVLRPFPTPLTTPLATPRQLSPRRLSNAGRRGGRGSRPSTQERSEFSRTSFTRTTLKELPMANPPVPVDFTRRKPLDGIRPQGNRLSAVNEDRGRGDSPSQSPETLTTQVQNKHYDSYRRSIVVHSKANSEKTKNSPEAWPRRDVSKPPFMLPETQANTFRYDHDRLNRSHNQALLRSFHHTAPKRPKTSPEVLERRPGSGSQQSTLSERIHLRAADDKLRELCSILGTPPGRTSQNGFSSDTQPPSLTASLSGTNNPLTRSHRTSSVSVSLASLRSRGGTPPSPGRGALVTSGSREHRDALRGLMRSQGGVSRRTTPDQGPIQLRRPSSGKGTTRRPSSGRGTTHLPPVTPKRRRTRRRPRCGECSRRLNVTTTYECRCGGIFCAQHRYAETHTCNFDYRTAGRNLLTLANPLVAPNKLPKI